MEIQDLIDLLVPEEPKTYPSGDGRPVPSVTSIIQMAGFGPDFSMVPREVMDFAKERGTFVHKACEYVDKGTLDYASVDPFIRGYVDAYLRFRRECKVEPIAIEKELVSSTLRFGGTPDLICFLNGRRAVVDRKTCDPASVSARLQTAGYHVLHNAVAIDFLDQRYGLRLLIDGNYKLVPHADGYDVDCFADLLDYARFETRRSEWRRKYYLGEKNNGND